MISEYTEVSGSEVVGLAEKEIADSMRDAEATPLAETAEVATPSAEATKVPVPSAEVTEAPASDEETDTFEPVEILTWEVDDDGPEVDDAWLVQTVSNWVVDQICAVFRNGELDADIGLVALVKAELAALPPEQRRDPVISDELVDALIREVLGDGEILDRIVRQVYDVAA